MTDNDIAQEYKDKVDLLDNNLEKEIRELTYDDSYDDVDIIYIGDNQGIYTNFQEIFALAAVKFEQDLSYSNKEEKFIEKIYEDLYDIQISTERYTITNSNGEEIEKRRKIITVYTYDMESIMSMSNLKFDDEQKPLSRRLVSNFFEQFPELAIQYGELTQEEIIYLIENAPEFTSKQQEKLYDTALSIVGKVKYFWGGKSSSGWNDEWGTGATVNGFKGFEYFRRVVKFQ